MSKKAGFGGAGGYGGISTMNQDQRGPRYGPHRTLVKWFSAETGLYQVKCLDCEQEWEHDRIERNFPCKCRKSTNRQDCHDG